jgi:acetyltransferase EpsM
LNFERSVLKRIAIYGAGGHAKSALEVCRDEGYEVVAVIEDNASQKIFCGIEVLSTIPDDYHERGIGVHFAIGNNSHRREIVGRALKFMDHGLLATLIHSSAVVSKISSVGPGTLIMPLAYVGPNTELGTCSIVNTGSIVEHDSIIGNFSSLGPGATLAGNVRVGDLTMIGMRASVLEKISIGSRVTVGANSLVTRDIPENSLGYGIPFKQKNSSFTN